MDRRGELGADEAMISCRLQTGDTVVGALIVTARRPGALTAEHLRLVRLLREPFAVALSNGLRYLELLELKEALADDNRFLAAELHSVTSATVVGSNTGLRHVMESVHQVARTASPVLLSGETGVGKEVIAAAVHQLSPRHDRPFIKVNCGAIPESLVDSELFGHEKGAFTGAAQRRRGRFERAQGGTIFLDEVGELPPSAQVRLLRVLQEKEIERVGGAEVLQLDIRIIAATHRDLGQMVADGRFREDLYFRLAVFPIVIPPLRARLEDIPQLARHFIEVKGRELGVAGSPTLTPAALAQLRRYPWPGNIRELANVIERSLIIDPAGPLRFELPEAPGRSLPSPPPPAPSGSLDAVIRAHICAVMTATGGRVGGPDGAAARLELNPSTLRKKMRRLGVPFGRGVTQWTAG